MNAAEITHGDAADVAEYFHREGDITIYDLIGAMVNAMNRIARLESEVATLKAHAQGRTRIKATRIPRSGA